VQNKFIMLRAVQDIHNHITTSKMMSYTQSIVQLSDLRTKFIRAVLYCCSNFFKTVAEQDIVGFISYFHVFLILLRMYIFILNVSYHSI